MAEFNRYVVTAEVRSAGADHDMTEEVYFSVSAICEDSIRSALPLKQIPHVHEWEIIDVKKQNE